LPRILSNGNRSLCSKTILRRKKQRHYRNFLFPALFAIVVVQEDRIGRTDVCTVCDKGQRR
jgi:hypothetical protein